MNKTDIANKFQTFEERDDVNQAMRIFTVLLSQIYGKHGTSMPHHKMADLFNEELEIDTTVVDKDELQREVDELRAKVQALEAEKQSIRD